MLLTIVNKFVANNVFEQNFESQNIEYLRYSTKPTPFNSILWSATAEADSGYYIGYYSLLDENEKVDFQFFPKRHDLLQPYLKYEKLQDLVDVTQGYFTVEQKDDTLVMNDLRFGQLDGWKEGKEGFTFVYQIIEQNGKLNFSQKPNDLKKGRALIGDLWDRILGEE